MKKLDVNKGTIVNRFLALHTQRGRGTIEGLTIAAASDHDILFSTIHLLLQHIYEMEPSHLLCNSLSASLLVNEFWFKKGGMPFLPHQRSWEKEWCILYKVHIVILILKDDRKVCTCTPNEHSRYNLGCSQLWYRKTPKWWHCRRKIVRSQAEGRSRGSRCVWAYTG